MINENSLINSSFSQDQNYINNKDKKKNFSNDLLFFKEDMLKDLKLLEVRFSEKIDKLKLECEKKYIEYDSKIEILLQKTSTLSSGIADLNNLKDSFTKFEAFKTKTNYLLNTQDVNMKLMSRELEEAINKYDKIVANNILLPGIIGVGCKFNSMHDFIGYTLKNINDLLSLKERVGLFDFRSLKIKVDSMSEFINKFKSKKLVNDILFKQYMVNNDKKITNLIEDYDKKFSEIISENNSKYQNIEDKNNNLYEQIQNVIDTQQKISGKFKEYEQKKYNNDNINICKIEKYENELYFLKKEYNYLENVVKKIKFKINNIKNNNSNKNLNLIKDIDENSSQEIKRNDHKLKNKTTIIRNNKYEEAESPVKNYINNKININPFKNNQREIHRFNSSKFINNISFLTKSFDEKVYHYNPYKSSTKLEIIDNEKYSEEEEDSKSIVSNKINFNEEENIITPPKKNSLKDYNKNTLSIRSEKKLKSNVLSRQYVHNLLTGKKSAIFSVQILKDLKDINQDKNKINNNNMNFPITIQNQMFNNEIKKKSKIYTIKETNNDANDIIISENGKKITNNVGLINIINYDKNNNNYKKKQLTEKKIEKKTEVEITSQVTNKTNTQNKEVKNKKNKYKKYNSNDNKFITIAHNQIKNSIKNEKLNKLKLLYKEKVKQEILGNIDLLNLNNNYCLSSRERIKNILSDNNFSDYKSEQNFYSS